MMLGQDFLQNSTRRLVRFFYLFTYGEKRIWGLSVLSVFMLFLAFYLNVYRAPADFPQQGIVHITNGMTLQDITNHLVKEDIIRSPFLLRSAVIVFGGDTNVQAGDYYFDHPQGVFTVAYRIAHGDLGLTPILVRVREGSTVNDMALLLGNTLPEFDADLFRTLARPHEGYLFPDTYFFPPNSTPEQVIALLKSTFDVRSATITDEITNFGKPLNEVVTMASIIEKEGHSLPDKRLIASVLWNRIRIGMPLQVDASFLYILGKGTHELSLDDLKTESPYNTYLHKGLPPGPIGSPSLESLLATVTPEETDYLYYLADKDGVTHFSETFEEHKEKKELYLN